MGCKMLAGKTACMARRWRAFHLGCTGTGATVLIIVAGETLYWPESAWCSDALAAARDTLDGTCCSDEGIAKPQSGVARWVVAYLGRLFVVGCGVLSHAGVTCNCCRISKHCKNAVLFHAIIHCG